MFFTARSDPNRKY
ncbi:unnamed protein product [Linum tenue]|uniref:Uncharacterized protein n=1 Tax=Linum tenue TaxID=586396 RepID=A0AAV0JFT2_9ROSI|nr:unnamed protein product [Linum tenue]